MRSARRAPTGSAGSAHFINPRARANGHWTFTMLGPEATQTPEAVEDAIARLGPLPERQLPRLDELAYGGPPVSYTHLDVYKRQAFDPFHHDAIRRARADRLGRLGLSAAKIKTLKHIARELADERLNLDVLANEDADAAHNTLTALPGIGPWTADVYLLFCLGHGDAWPAGDLAVQEAVKVGLGLKERPTPKQMAPLAEPWRPLRGAAAHLWWAYYRVLKNREGVIASAK